MSTATMISRVEIEIEARRIFDETYLSMEPTFVPPYEKVRRFYVAEARRNLDNISYVYPFEGR